MGLAKNSPIVLFEVGLLYRCQEPVSAFVGRERANSPCTNGTSRSGWSRSKSFRNGRYLTVNHRALHFCNEFLSTATVTVTCTNFVHSHWNSEINMISHDSEHCLVAKVAFKAWDSARTLKCWEWWPRLGIPALGPWAFAKPDGAFDVMVGITIWIANTHLQIRDEDTRSRSQRNNDIFFLLLMNPMMP